MSGIAMVHPSFRPSVRQTAADAELESTIPSLLGQSFPATA